MPLPFIFSGSTSIVLFMLKLGVAGNVLRQGNKKRVENCELTGSLILLFYLTKISKIDIFLHMENQKNIEKSSSQTLTKKQEILNFVKFGLFSASAGIIQVVSFTLFSELLFKDGGNKYGISYFISLALSVLWNFTFNRKFTFKSANNVGVAMILVLIYYEIFTPLSILWGNALTNNGWNEYLVLIGTMIINMLTEFLWTRYVVYKDSINTANIANENKQK